MKKISVLFVVPFIFCSAVWAQVTQVASDSIVLERMNTETRPHTIYAKENLQAEGMTITTVAGEIIEFDYSCWVYYIHYDDQADETFAARRYFIVKEISGNLLEVNTQNDYIPNNLTEWRIVLKDTLPDIPDSITIQWTAELNCNWYPLDSVVITNKSNSEKMTVYYPDTVNTYFLYEYGDTLILQGFITENDIFQYKEHIVPLTEDAFITFAFFNEDALDISKGIITNLLIRSRGDTMPYYFKHVYTNPLGYPDNKLMLVNTQTALDSLFVWDSSFVLPAVDFSNQTLILMQGYTPDVIVPDTTQRFSITKYCNGNYVINMEILTGGLDLRDEFYWLLIVDEVISNEEQIELITDITPSNIPIKICGIDDPLTELQWMEQERIWSEYIFLCIYKGGIGFLISYGGDHWELMNCDGTSLCQAVSIAGRMCPQYTIDWASLKTIWSNR